MKSQFESSGTTPFLDITTHREAFARAPSLEIPGLASLKIVKFGLLSRKELEDGKKSKRSWTNWAVILTTSQLLFFVSADLSARDRVTNHFFFPERFKYGQYSDRIKLDRRATHRFKFDFIQTRCSPFTVQFSGDIRLFQRFQINIC